MISETAIGRLALLLKVIELNMNSTKCKPCFLSMMPPLQGIVLVCSLLDKYVKMGLVYTLQTCWECFV